MKLLLVEDDQKIAAAVRRGLEAEGYAVQVAFDGDDGYWRATEGSYDLIILDIMLPKRNGYRVCASLRYPAELQPPRSCARCFSRRTDDATAASVQRIVDRTVLV